MFYTYLRGLVAFILWVLNGNAHYHHKDNIPDREENYILVSPPDLVGSGLYGLCNQAKTIYLYG